METVGYHRISSSIIKRAERYAPPLHVGENVSFSVEWLPVAASLAGITFPEAWIHTVLASSSIDTTLYARYAVMQARPQVLKTQL